MVCATTHNHAHGYLYVYGAFYYQPPRETRTGHSRDDVHGACKAEARNCEAVSVGGRSSVRVHARFHVGDCAPQERSAIGGGMSGASTKSIPEIPFPLTKWNGERFAKKFA